LVSISRFTATTLIVVVKIHMIGVTNEIVITTSMVLLRLTKRFVEATKLFSLSL